MEIIRTYAPGTPERENLKKAAQIFTIITGKPHKVEDIYFDFGQNWMWSTITTESNWGGVQILYPADYESIIYAPDGLALIDAVKAKCKKEKWI